jgi:hypothetical protein
MSTTYKVDPTTHSTIQRNPHEPNVPVEGKFAGWKYYRPGIIMIDKLGTNEQTRTFILKIEKVKKHPDGFLQISCATIFELDLTYFG